MSFTGDLEHLSIVDVIQLLNSTRKSGTLCVRGRKAENQIVFKNGFLVGANHSNTGLRIGNILLEMKAITAETLERALAGQQSAGDGRKPLIATLVEGGLVNRKAALKGLERLIQVTVVEMVSWRRGTFSLDVDNLSISDEYRYFPENLHQEICLDAQMVLMDALRIYDEKVRDGLIVEDEEDEEDGDDEEAVVLEEAQEQVGSFLSAEDLGLADLDLLEKKIPETFSGLEVFDPCKLHRQKISETIPGATPEEQEALIDFLLRSQAPAGCGDTPLRPLGKNRGIVLFSQDELLVHTVMTTCKQDGMLIFVAAEPADLDPIIDQSLSKGIVPVLVFDAPGEGPGGQSREAMVQLRRQKIRKYSRITLIQLAPPGEGEFALQALRDGARAVLPKPAQINAAGFVAGFILFLDTFREYLKGYFLEQEQKLSGRFRDGISRLRDLKEAPEVSLAMLGFTAEMFERALTFVVRKEELMAERGIGIGRPKDRGAGAPLRFTVPLAGSGQLSEVIESGGCFFGEAADGAIRDQVFGEIGAPASPHILLLPLKARGRTIAVTYADFGDRPAAPVQLELLEILAGHAGTVMENCLYRKQLEKIAP
ncbi:DUF4388 domain-containing protein [Desulfuromonas versatilis]|nr:DUF4388 domain-containing protein [Desulfuromonas versatilis]